MVLNWTIADKTMVWGSHFPRPGLRKIVRDGAGYALTVHTA